MIWPWIGGTLLLIISWILFLLGGMSFESEEDRISLITTLVGIVVSIAAVLVLPV